MSIQENVLKKLKSSSIGKFFISYIVIGSGLLTNLLQLILLVIWPFSKRLYRKINQYFAQSIISGSKNFRFHF